MASKVKTAGGLDFVTDAVNARNEHATLRTYATNRCNESALWLSRAEHIHAFLVLPVTANPVSKRDWPSLEARQSVDVLCTCSTQIHTVTSVQRACVAMYRLPQGFSFGAITFSAGPQSLVGTCQLPYHSSIRLHGARGEPQSHAPSSCRQKPNNPVTGGSQNHTTWTGKSYRKPNLESCSSANVLSCLFSNVYVMFVTTMHAT